MISIQASIISTVASIVRPIYDAFPMQEEAQQIPRAASKAIRESLVKWIADKDKRASVYSALWVVLVTINCLLSVALFGLSRIFGGGIRGPAIGTAILWGLLFGVAALFFLPGKAVVTLWGCALGTSLDKAVTGAGVLKSASQLIASTASELAASLPIAEELAKQLVWVFVLTFVVVCVPAFFRDK